MTRTAIQCIDDALAFFGPNGEQWDQGVLYDSPRACLIGGLVTSEVRLCGDTFTALETLPRDLEDTLANLISQRTAGQTHSLIEYNDSRSREWADIQSLLLDARAHLMGQTGTD